MTTTTQEVKGWTPEQEAEIAKLMESQGISRPEAIRKMKAGKPSKAEIAKTLDAVVKTRGAEQKRDDEAGKKALKAAKAAKKAKPAAKKAAKPKEAGECHLTESQKEKVTQAVRKLIGAKAAVEGIVRSSLNPSYGLYIWYGIDNGKVVSVRGFDSAEIVAEYKEESSWAVKEWKKIQARRQRREEKAAKKADNAAAKKAQAAAK